MRRSEYLKALDSTDREIRDVAGGGASDIRTDGRQEDLDAVARAHHLAATRRNPTIHQKPVEGDALIAQWIALVDADDRRRQAFDILSLGEAGPCERVAGVKGLDAVSHGGAVVPEVEHDALILDGGRVLRLRPLTGDVGAQGVDALDVHHLSDKSQDTVKLGAGVIATMSALVLGLLVSSAKNSYDVASANVAQIGAKFIELDELLAEYGPETMPLREQVKTILAGRIDLLWHPQANTLSVLLTNERSKTIATLQNSLGALVPVSEEQKMVLGELWQINGELRKGRLLLIEQQREGLPPILLGLLVFRLTLLFVSFGLFAPRNVTVITVLMVCALSVSSAIFLILEMSRPLEGMIKVSSAPLLEALKLIGH